MATPTSPALITSPNSQQKRTREPKPHSHPHQSIPAPPSYPGTSSTGAYPFPYQYPFWGSPPYAIPNPPSNSGRPTPITTTQPFERLTSSMSCDAPSYTTTQSYPSQQPSQSSQPPVEFIPTCTFSINHTIWSSPRPNPSTSTNPKSHLLTITRCSTHATSYHLLATNCLTKTQTSYHLHLCKLLTHLG